MQRDKTLDNAKGILIFLVVFGHCLELSKLPYAAIVHNFIYAFHMPAFVYLAGTMSNQKSTGKVGLSVLKGVIIPFIVFSILYEMLWYQKTLSPYSHFIRNFAPFWIMWFMFALAFWKIIAPVFEAFKYPVLYSIAIAIGMFQLSAGENSLSITRIFYFMPFFMLGYLYGNRINMKIIELVSGRLIASIVATAILISLIVYVSRPEIFYGNMTFVDVKIILWHGVIYFALAYTAFAAAIVLILSLAKATDIFNASGERSLYVYLWHGVALYGLSDFFEPLIKYTESHIVVIGPVLLSVFLCTLFSLRFVKRTTDAVHNSIRFFIAK